MNATRRKTDEIGRIDISYHARLRAMQRLGVIERAADHIRELLAKAQPIDDDRFPACRAYRCGDVTIVLDRGEKVVQTVVTEVRR